MSAPKTQTIMIRGQQIHLHAPTSFTVCQEVANLTATNVHRGAAAALGVCWPEARKPGAGMSRKERRAAARERRKATRDAEERKALTRPKLSYAVFGDQPARFGQQFLDKLMVQADELGIPYDEIFAAGIQAYRLVASQLPGGAEYFEEVEGNFSDGMSEE
ncbi:MAG: hypothetical protein AAFV53_03020 [Myxococcota bacterium]